MAGACCAAKQWQEALELLEVAHSDGLQPNAKTVSLVMKTMTLEGQWQPLGNQKSTEIDCF